MEDSQIVYSFDTEIIVCVRNGQGHQLPEEKRSYYEQGNKIGWKLYDKKKERPISFSCGGNIFQQLTGKAAESIYRRFLNYYGNSYPDPDKILATSDEAMRSFGLSSRKVEYIKMLSESKEQKSRHRSISKNA